MPERGPRRLMSEAAAIRGAAIDLGFTQVGFAPADRPVHADAYLQWIADGWHGEMAWMAREDSVRRRVAPEDALPGCRSIVVVSLQYGPIPGSRTDPDAGAPIVATYAEGRDYHLIFEERLERLAAAIREAFADAEPATRTYVDYGPVLERDHAQRAGLGWIGKNSCLIHPRHGSYLFIGEVLTTASIPPDPPFTADRCGTCTRCIEACPTGAIKDGRLVDARLCISYLTIELKGRIPETLRPAIGSRVFGCDICQDVCPWNEGVDPANRTAFESWKDPVDRASLVSWTAALIDMSDEEYRETYRSSPLGRPGREAMLRNLCVGLGNSGSADAVPLLRCVLDRESALVREHANWALVRLGAAPQGD